MKLLKSVIKKLIGEKVIYKLRIFNETRSSGYKRDIIKRKVFFEQFINKGELYFDVGANIGNRIAPMLEIGAKVVAVEPQESCNKYLKNKYGNKITIVTKGIGDKEGVKKFHISNADTISSFSEEWINSVKDDRFKGFNWDKTIDMEMTTLDNLIKLYGVPSFIKIDVEGYELEVLKGLSFPIKMISFEYTVPEQTSKVIECVKSIERINQGIVCNYSIGESMEWAISEWISVADFIKLTETIDFIKSGFGDVYVKNK